MTEGVLLQQVKRSMGSRIAVYTNGNVSHASHVRANLARTGCD